MSRSKKKVGFKSKTASLKRDIRKVKNRGLRRFVKLQIKAGEFDDLPDAPRSTKVSNSEE